jgi:hypothetical protein
MAEYVTKSGCSWCIFGPPTQWQRRSKTRETLIFVSCSLGGSRTAPILHRLGRALIVNLCDQPLGDHKGVSHYYPMDVTTSRIGAHTRPRSRCAGSVCPKIRWGPGELSTGNPAAAGTLLPRIIRSRSVWLLNHGRFCDGWYSEFDHELSDTRV